MSKLCRPEPRQFCLPGRGADIVFRVGVGVLGRRVGIGTVDTGGGVAHAVLLLDKWADKPSDQEHGSGHTEEDPDNLDPEPVHISAAPCTAQVLLPGLT